MVEFNEGLILQLQPNFFQGGFGNQPTGNIKPKKDFKEPV